MHDSRTIANRFLELAEDDGNTLTPMQLLKLVYIAHGWSLGLFARPLVRDHVEAWQYGPVIPALYEQIRRYRGAPVNDRVSAPVHDPINQRADDLIQDVYRRYGRRDGFDLSQLTHAPSTPWSDTYRSGEFGRVISNDLIQDYYENLATQK